jgi:alpha-ketoglutarate-dependent taurine dioxygenase
MARITTRKLSEYVGAEVVGVDVDQLLNDDDLPAACLQALEENGVLLFRELNIDDESQVAFGRRLGALAQIPGYPNPEVMEISFDPANPNAAYFPSNDHWHFDGSMDDIPAKAALMSARVIADHGGETEFASTYVAYDSLSAAEKERFEGLRVLHTFESIQRRSYKDPTPEQLDDWASWAEREHPLVWEHESGRRSLVFGASCARVLGLDVEESEALLAELEARSTAPERVLRHSWSVGDMVIWDNLGLVHRACPFDRSKPRRMQRTTVAGVEAIR